jgi:hypothetical protein
MLFPNFYVPSVIPKMANYELFPHEFNALRAPGKGFRGNSSPVHQSGKGGRRWIGPMAGLCRWLND